jgi:putative hydrolase of HD superfamily
MVGAMQDKGESIADHAFGTTLTTLLIALFRRQNGDSIDIAKALMMAILHDLPESLISDIPTGDALPGREQLVRAKEQAETEAMDSLLKSLDKSGYELLEVWKEFQTGKSLEARIVHAADTLDMLSHAIALEKSGMKAGLLDEFFISTEARLESLQIPLVSKLYNALRQMHDENMGDSP